MQDTSITRKAKLLKASLNSLFLKTVTQIKDCKNDKDEHLVAREYFIKVITMVFDSVEKEAAHLLLEKILDEKFSFPEAYIAVVKSVP